MGGLVAPTLNIGRYAVFEAFASGGMGTVHFGYVDDDGVRRPVAVKRLHPHLRKEAAFADLILDEARLAMSVRHRNVVEVIDVVSTQNDLLLVMEYVRGLSLHELIRAAPEAQVPLDVAVTIAVDVLRGLHAAHEAVGTDGKPLGLVHRDVSPQNVIVDMAGMTKLTDFGVAKAAGRLRSTRDGSIKGKIAYMSPEQVACTPLDARADVYAAAVVLWEMLAGRPMFDAQSDLALIGKAMRGPTEHLSAVAPGIPHALDAAIWRALSRDPRRRHPSALAFAESLIEAVGMGDSRKVAAWALERGQTELEARECIVSRVLHRGDLHVPAALATLPGEELATQDARLDAAPHAFTATQSGRVPAQPAVSGMLGARAAAFVLAALITVTVGTLFVRAKSRPTAVDSSGPSELGSQVVPPPSAMIEPATDPPQVQPDSPTAPEPSALASSTARQIQSSPASGLQRRPPTPPRRQGKELPKPPTASEPKRDCNPPYSIDRNGDRHFKPECLR